ncbi:hypothetical protein [Akkermansia muciniphila]|uniref:hypothetical protein n=1 Tax=Akkermansia muciniphila TaxID=239935 RepID=UPI0015E15AC8|nr:hypothetical protein [Akkermansia muciniphila]
MKIGFPIRRQGPCVNSLKGGSIPGTGNNINATNPQHFDDKLFCSLKNPDGNRRDRKIPICSFPGLHVFRSFKFSVYGPRNFVLNAFFQIYSLSPDWKSANLHSFPTGKHAFISMNHSASRFYLLLNLSCFTAFAAPLPEEHTSSMTTFSRVQLPISRPQPNIAFQAYNF